jgi:hypothetical protein
MGCNERDPNERILMFTSTFWKKALAKGAVGALFAALLGYTWKLNKEVDAEIDEYFDKKNDEEETS